MFLSKLSINRPVMVSMGLMVFIVFGLMAYFGLSLNLMPDADIPYVTIQTIYPGAGPAEVETQITKPIEDAVSTVSKIDFVESYSLDNASIVVIAFELGKDVDIAVAEIKQKVDAVLKALPDDAERPTVEKVDIGAEAIMQIILTGDLSGLELFEIADKKLKDKFSQVEGVANVEITGGQEREIHVELDDRVVFQNKISLQQLGQIIAASNMDMPGGQFQQKDQEYSVRLEGQLDEVDALNELDIPTAYGIKKLRQLARVTDTGEEVRKRSIYFNNVEQLRKENIVKLSIFKTSEGNPVRIATGVKSALEGIKKTLPQGAELRIIRDDTDYIQGTIDDTMSNVIQGIILTGLVLLFFLHDLRSTLIVAIAMPTSIVSTFMLMQWAGFSLNMLSLMGLSTSVGVLVSNSIVVLENIFRHMELGYNRREASDIGTAEVTVAVIASTLTNIVVFVPLATMNTIVGQFLKEFAMTVTFATIFSLIISFTITPMMAAMILPEKKKKNPIGEAFEKMFHHWEEVYGKTLKWVLKNRKTAGLTTLTSVVLFILTIMIIGPTLGFELFPATDEGKINIDLELPVGYNLGETAQVYNQIEKIVASHKEVEQILVSLGSQGQIDEAVNLATMDITLSGLKERDLSSQELVDIITRELSVISNAKIKVSSAQSMGGHGAAIEFYLQGDDVETISNITNEFIDKAKSIKGLMNLDSNLKSGKPEITLFPKRRELATSGLTIYDLALTMRASLEGVTATKYREVGEEYDVIISLKDDSIDSPEKIKNIPVVGSHGTYRLSQLADVEFTQGTTKIVHRDKIKSASFSAGLSMGYAQGDVMKQLIELQESFDLPHGYRFIWGGMSEMMNENTREMAKAFVIAILLTYMLLAAMMESLFKPVLILVTIPLALIGVLIAMYIFNVNMGMMAMMGIIMLVGIVVNAAILMLDYTETLRKNNMTTKDALMEACPTKLKPILMSSVAIIFSMLPMAMGIGASGAEMRIPMGIVSIGGIFVSTFMTLYVLPAMYYIFTKEHEKKLKQI